MGDAGVVKYDLSFVNPKNQLIFRVLLRCRYVFSFLQRSIVLGSSDLEKNT